jgi:hypothetical protein
MKTLLLILSLLLITTNAYAEWTLYFINAEGSDHFYDKSTIKMNGDKVKVWAYMNFTADEERAKSLNVSSVRILEEIDCVNETSKTLSMQSFTKPDLEGDMRDMTRPNPTISYIVPDSPNADLMKLVCKK